MLVAARICRGPRYHDGFASLQQRRRSGGREDVAEEDEFVGRLAPREREVLLMHEVHGVPLQEVAVALGVTPVEAEALLASAHRRVRAADKAAH